MGQDKMAPTWLNLKTFKNIGVFLLGRYPFINAGVLMMVLGERAAKDKKYVIYLCNYNGFWNIFE